MSADDWTLIMRDSTGARAAWDLRSVAEILAAATVVRRFWPDLRLTAHRLSESTVIADRTAPDHRTAEARTEVR